MVVAVIYNLKGTLPDSQRVPRDLEAEYQEDRELEAIQDAIQRNGFETVLLPCDLDLPGKLQECRVELAFNVAEGWGGRGRESFVPALLDMFGIPYTGSDAVTLGVSLDKALTKLIARSQGVATPSYATADSVDSSQTISLSFPLFVKPNAEGSSMGISEGALVEDHQQLRAAVERILERYGEPALIEQFMGGREFTVGLVGNGTDLKTLPVLEILLPEDVHYYPYERKAEHARTLQCPADIPETVAEEIRGMARVVYRAIECRDFARVDFRADDGGRPHFLEINPLPGLHPETSLFPQQAYALGLSYVELIGDILDAAISRYHQVGLQHHRSVDL
jgi:D-alanine-D-alanine ligase